MSHLKTICLAYASVIFSADIGAGLVILATTFLIPVQGLTGLLGGALALIFARASGFSDQAVREGRLIYNPVLACLMLACWYPFDLSAGFGYLLLLAVVSISSLVLTIILNSYSVLLNGISSMSLPFSIVGIGLHWFLVQKGVYWSYSPPPVEPSVSPLLRAGFLSLAEISFVPSIFAGIVVAGMLLRTSRLSFLHAVVGLVVANAFVESVGFNESDSSWIYLDCMLTSVALGGIFYVPSLPALTLAAVGSGLCAALGIALLKGLSFLDAPVLTLPFVITTVGLVSALRWRNEFQQPQPVTFDSKTPEATHQLSQLYHHRYEEAELPRIAPPFDGAWTVTQGFCGQVTHLGPWKYALDFEVTPCTDEPKPDGFELSDYPSFDAPIIAPCAGRVLQLVDDVKDNPIGQTNMTQNWGNMVVIEVNPQLFVFLCHFRQRGIKVREGERVRQGQLLGYLGNSGRSPVPHLHLHLQSSPDLGAPTIPFRLRGYRTLESDETAGIFHFSGLPEHGDSIMGARPARWLTQTPDHWATDEQTSSVVSNNGKTTERLALSAEAYGVLCWKSLSMKAEYRAQILDGVLTPVSFTGSDKSLLRLLWLVGRIPLVPYKDLEWTEVIEPGFDLPPLIRSLTEVIAPFIPAKPRLLRGKCIGINAQKEIYQIACTVESSVAGQAPALSLEFIFGAGLSLVSIRKESARGWLRSHHEQKGVDSHTVVPPLSTVDVMK